jgi:hypothetical protein
MKLDETHPANLLLIRHLSSRNPNAALLASPVSEPYAYLTLGSHPDIVEYVWTALCASLQADCRAIVHGTPALAHPDAGIMFAFAYGTQYLLRLFGTDLDAARAAGYRNEQTWAGGNKTNSEEVFGPGWLFGAWGRNESEWMLNTYAALGRK